MSLDPRPGDAELLARPHASGCICNACLRGPWVGGGAADDRLAPWSLVRPASATTQAGGIPEYQSAPFVAPAPLAPRGRGIGKLPRISEKQVEAAGDRLMHAHGFTAVRFSQARATRQSPGIPDRRYVHPGRRLAVWWEAKAPGGKQRPAQRAFQLLVESVGERYLLGGVEALEGWLASVARDEAAEKTAAERRLGVSSPAYTVDEFGAPIVPPPTP